MNYYPCLVGDLTKLLPFFLASFFSAFLMIESAWQEFKALAGDANFAAMWCKPGT